MKKNIGLYIHFPFCEQKCKYCDFCSFSGLYKYQEKYVEQLIKEIKESADKIKSNLSIKTIFLGGGTPSSMADGLIQKVLSCVYELFDCTELEEVTIECNPNSITQKKLVEYKQAQINRVSIGVQSLDDNVLQSVGRVHKSKEAINAIKLVQQYNFNCSVDIMCGLPKQTILSFKDTVRQIIKHKPQHISCYTLILEENTQLYREVINNEVALPSEEQTLEMYNFAVKELEKNGYAQYEVSNFARKNYECKHNINYWSCGEYLGFGINAHSYFDGSRFCNTNNFQQYLSQTNFIDNKSFSEIIDSQTQKTEYIMLGLRMNKGIDLEMYRKLFNEDILATKKDIIKKLEKNRMISYNNHNLFVQQEYMNILNPIILELID